MKTEEILATIDREIVMLQQARALLSSDVTPRLVAKLLGRPKGSAKAASLAGKKPKKFKKSKAGKTPVSGGNEIPVTTPVKQSVLVKKAVPALAKGAGKKSTKTSSVKRSGDKALPLAKKSAGKKVAEVKVQPEMTA